MVGHPGFERVGELHVVDIGVPGAVEQQAEFAAEVLEPGDIATRLLDTAPQLADAIVGLWSPPSQDYANV